MIEKIHGMKTYITAMGLIMYAIGGFVAGKLEYTTAIPTLFVALGMMGFRHRIEVVKKYFEKYLDKEKE